MSSRLRPNRSSSKLPGSGMRLVTGRCLNGHEKIFQIGDNAQNGMPCEICKRPMTLVYKVKRAERYA